MRALLATLFLLVCCTAAAQDRYFYILHLNNTSGAAQEMTGYFRCV